MGIEMLEAYLYEMNSLLGQMDELVLAAETAGGFSQEDVNEIFRIMHTIKGSSAMMEYNQLMTVAHRIEDLFFVIRDKTMAAVPDSAKPELFDLIFKAIDFFRGEAEKLENNETLTEDIDSLLKNINAVSDKIQGNVNAQGEEAQPTAEAAETPAAAPAVEAPAGFPNEIQIFFDEGSGMEHLRAYMLVNAVKEYLDDDAFAYRPEDVGTNPETANEIIENGFYMCFKSESDRSMVLPAITGSSSVHSYQLIDVLTAPEAPAASPAAKNEPITPVQTELTEVTASDEKAETEKAPAAAPKAKDAAPAANDKSKQQHSKESPISVNLSKLDKLMAIVGEIVITESMVTASPDLQGLKLDNFTQATRQLRSLTDELQDISMSLRMVPVSATFQKMKRIVRDMAKKLNKDVNLVLVGEDTEVDKTIVDSISDPIMHIVRNSMDHGIESDPAERMAEGKSATGEIVLSAGHTGSEVIIEISDDGQGADDDKILAKAIKQGIASPDEEYSHKDILNFLLMPGFSTNTEVTEYSGRGVGMDVVKSNVEAVGGTVTITSEKGKGMTTTLKIPLTMAILDGMEVEVGGSIFTIPINNVRQIFKVSQNDIIHDAANGEMIKVMDGFYSVIRTKDLYGLENGHDNIEDGILMWVESGEITYCLFVDRLIGEQKVVVKPLPSYVNNFGIKSYGISGCTILGNGNISMIMDIANIYSAAQQG